ncbi:hypothetical protein CSAL01_05794 [Colletotrichum salicis]|uniref:Uncharacterized protein n=1 Tax=Colletotrichum salicis TaxID=1209931 RepID=A0A135SP11_9PEZI|nr:hypothetical protein CSAL01_05794 [Colletotrichum salicis]
MSSTTGAPPTYHVVPRFDIAAKGGALELGTHIIPIPDGLKYTPVSQGGFIETQSRLREGHGSIWATSFVSQGFGASAGASADDQAQSTVSCESIITSYFDPDDDYLPRNYVSIPSTAAARSANFETSATEPDTGTKLGANGGGSSKDKHSLEFEVDDIVVSRYPYKDVSSSPFNKEKKLVGMPIPEEEKAKEKVRDSSDVEVVWVEAARKEDLI